MLDKFDKYDTYKILFSKLNKPIKNEFYLEAIFIVYAIMEDRLKSLLVIAKKEDPNQISLSRKLTAIKNYHQLKSSILHRYLKLESLEDIKNGL